MPCRRILQPSLEGNLGAALVPELQATERAGARVLSTQILLAAAHAQLRVFLGLHLLSITRREARATSLELHHVALLDSFAWMGNARVVGGDESSLRDLHLHTEHESDEVSEVGKRVVGNT